MFNFGTTKVIQETLGDTEDVAKDHWGFEEKHRGLLSSTYGWKLGEKMTMHVCRHSFYASALTSYVLGVKDFVSFVREIRFSLFNSSPSK